MDDDDNVDGQQIMQQYNQEEVNEWYVFSTNNIRQQDSLTRLNDAPRHCEEWKINKRDETTVKKLEKKRVEREQYLIRKYSADVILRCKPVTDTQSAGNNNTTIINTNCNKNNTTTINSWVQRRETKLSNNDNYSNHNFQVLTAELVEEVRVREQNRTTATTTVNTNPELCCAGIHCGIDNSPLDSKNFHKCNTCRRRLHGFLCCVASTFDEHTGTGKCKRCALPS